ncbi:MAG TPA: hypothetical protein VLH84_04070 [Patescibacteria group bacterium]|nr:hypothetical protein [Patescibacteria group bacterium]
MSTTPETGLTGPPQPPLLPAAVLGVAPEHANPHGQLHGELREQRARDKYEQAIAYAKNCTTGALKTLEAFNAMLEPGSQQREFALRVGTTPTDLGTRFPFERVILQALGESAGTDDLARRSRTMHEGDEVRIDSGRGFVVSGRAFADRRASWRIGVTDGLDPAAGEAALDTFRSTFRGATQKYTATQRELHDGLSTERPAVYSSATFRWDDEADGIISLMENANIREREFSSPAVQRAGFIEDLYAMPAHYANEPAPTGAMRERAGIYFDENGRVQKVLIPTWRPGVYYGLESADPTQTGDLTEIPLKLGMEVYSDEAYIELDYNSKYHEGSRPFVETETAAQILDAFEATGLEINSVVRGIVTETDMDKRYGHAYAALTREIAKLVNDPERGLDRMFNDADGAIADRIRALREASDPAARTVIDLLKAVVDRTATPQDAPILPLSSHRVEIRDGSCKDIEVYLADGQPIHDSTGNARLLAAPYSRPVAMTRQPTYLNGVRLPSGTLLAVEDDGYLMMRVTAFAFDDQVAAEAFGPQEGENRAHVYGSRREPIRSSMVFA